MTTKDATAIHASDMATPGGVLEEIEAYLRRYVAFSSDVMFMRFRSLSGLRARTCTKTSMRTDIW
jgi:hypothetical protein